MIPACQTFVDVVLGDFRLLEDQDLLANTFGKLHLTLLCLNIHNFTA
jgi:hypothetical protein